MIGIVILNYNTFELTETLVEALHKQTISDRLYIVVVDNASPNDSFIKLKPLESLYNNVKVIQTGENLGYAKGNNFGLEYLDREIHPEYVAILNNDVILTEDCFEKLIYKYNKLDNPCIIAPLQLTPKGKISILGNLGNFWSDVKLLSMFYRIFSKPKDNLVVDNTGNNAYKVEAICGSFMFSSMVAFKNIGFFYPNTFLYVEERFVAYNSKRLGYNNYVILDQTYIHDHISPTISKSCDNVGKYKVYYKSLFEYNKVCRPHGKVKAAILKPLINISLIEIKIVNFIKTIRFGKN